eukprot:TRINITY_DN52598_c0_g1_i1.p1 TRINITY_DN52598_c0_g1~~TRINITY_DN52598_c0_g1_i1.p1  ORF type:complete len:181 (-),score=42.20 TRINITY_DN52598_c0_g1_i1:45-587(-)
MIRRPPRSTLSSSSAASDVYKRQLLCGKGLCEYAMEYTLPAGVSERKCTSSAVYGLWLFFGSNCACVVALLINLRIIHMLVHIKMETRKQMHNLRQHRVEAYLYQCIRDAEDNEDRGEVKQLRHMLGVVAGAVSYTHLRAHETPEHLVCRLLLEKKKKNSSKSLIRTNLNKKKINNRNYE